MRFIYFISILLLFNIISCKSSDNKEGNPKTTNHELTTEEHLIIIGRIHTHNFGTHSNTYYTTIKDEYENEYYIYPHEKGEELRNYTGCLIRFTVLVHDEPKGWAALFSFNGRKKTAVTPINWEIIEGSPIISPIITELGVVQLTGILKRTYPKYTIITKNGQWFIESAEHNLHDFINIEITIEGEGKIISPFSPIITPYNEPEHEQNSLHEFSSFRELRNVRVLLNNIDT